MAHRSSLHRRVVTTGVFAVILLVGLMHALRTDTPAKSTTADYLCDGDQPLTATYLRGEAKPPRAVDGPPTPGGRVELAYQGQRITLPQTLSADGGRYANADEKVVWWAKGAEAQLHDASRPASDVVCIELPPRRVGDLAHAFVSYAYGFSLRLPRGYTADQSYVSTNRATSLDLPGVFFAIPEWMAAGTNLSADSGLSVEQLRGAESCEASEFLDASRATQVSDAGVEYSFASTTGAGAGNRYEEWVYALPDSVPCTLVRYYLHSTVVENYPPGTVRRFDPTELIAEFDQIRRSLIVVTRYGKND